jgi:hypothetical protein
MIEELSDTEEEGNEEIHPRCGMEKSRVQGVPARFYNMWVMEGFT